MHVSLTTMKLRTYWDSEQFNKNACLMYINIDVCTEQLFIYNNPLHNYLQIKTKSFKKNSNLKASIKCRSK